MTAGAHGQPGRYKRVILSRFALIVPLNYGLRHCRTLCATASAVAAAEPSPPPTPSPPLPRFTGLEGTLFPRRRGECIVRIARRALLVTACFCENAALDFPRADTMRPQRDIKGSSSRHSDERSSWRLDETRLDENG